MTTSITHPNKICEAFQFATNAHAPETICTDCPMASWSYAENTEYADAKDFLINTTGHLLFCYCRAYNRMINLSIRACQEKELALQEKAEMEKAQRPSPSPTVGLSQPQKRESPAIKHIIIIIEIIIEALQKHYKKNIERYKKHYRGIIKTLQKEY